MLVFVLNQAQKANTGKIQTPVYENVREFGISAWASVLSCRKKEQSSMFRFGSRQLRTRVINVFYSYRF